MPPSDPAHLLRVDGGGGAPAVRMAFTGVGTWMRGAVATPRHAAVLDPTAACLTAPPTVVMTYDEPTRNGHVVLVVARPHLTCHGEVTPQGIALGQLATLTQAIAAFRNQLAATVDIRLYGFRAGLHVEDEHGAVTLWLDGQDPVDGTGVAPCIGLDGEERCRDGEASALVAAGRRTRALLTE